MQAPQFDKLMAGECSMYADLKKIKPSCDEKSITREIIQKHEEPIPYQMNEQIQTLISHRRKLKDSEANIRRLVKKIFHITVI